MTTPVPDMPIPAAAEHTGAPIPTIRRWAKRGIIHTARTGAGVTLVCAEQVGALAAATTRRTTGVWQPVPVHRDTDTHAGTSIGLFAGAGGTALGFANAGFQHVLLNEVDPHAVATLRQNRPDWNVIDHDIATVDFTPWYGQVDVVEGGFPCQAFSYAGRRAGFADIRGTLFVEFARAIEETMPRVFVGENVKGLTRHDQGRTLDTILRTLSGIRDPHTGAGYRVAHRVMRAQFHDVPQARERTIIIGIRSDVGDDIFFPREHATVPTCWDAIGDRPAGDGIEYSAARARILEQVPAGGNWRDLPERVQREYLGASFGTPGGQTSTARRLTWDEPSHTLMCSPTQKQTERCHPDDTRPLTVREYARIQTFPDDWQFAGRRDAQYRQIGNAVPVNLAYWIATAVRAMCDGTAHADPRLEPALPNEYAPTPERRA